MILSRFLRRRFSRTRFRWSDHPHRALFCQRRPLRRGFDSRRHNWSNHWGRRWASWSHAHCRGLRTVTVRSCRPARRTVRSAGRACRIRGVGCVHRNIFLRRPMQKRQLILVPRAHTRNDHHRQHHSTNHKLLLPYALPLRPVNTKRIVRIHMFRRTRKIQRRLRQQILQRINLFFSRGNGLLRHPRRGGRRRRFTHPHDWQLHPNRRRRDAALCPLLCLNFGCRRASALRLLPRFFFRFLPGLCFRRRPRRCFRLSQSPRHRFLIVRPLLSPQFLQLRLQRRHFILQLRHVLTLRRSHRLASIVFRRLFRCHRFGRGGNALAILLRGKRHATKILFRLREFQLHKTRRRPVAPLVHHLANHFLLRSFFREKQQLTDGHRGGKLNHRSVFKHQHRGGFFREKFPLVVRRHRPRPGHAHRDFQGNRIRPHGPLRHLPVRLFPFLCVYVRRG